MKGATVPLFPVTVKRGFARKPDAYRLPRPVNRSGKFAELDKRREAILPTTKLTPELEARINAAENIANHWKIFISHKPKGKQELWRQDAAYRCSP